MIKSLNLKNSQATKPLIYLTASLIVFLLISIFAVTKTLGQHRDLTRTRNENNNLKNKLQILESLPDNLSSAADPIANALMSTNPTPVVVTQLRRLAAEHGIIIGSFKSTAKLEDRDLGMSKTVIDFKIEGTLVPVLEFLKDVENIAPIITFAKVNIFSDTDYKSGGITLTSYWADYPTTLPDIESQANKLTDQEEDLLIDLLSLKQPLTQKLQPQPPKTRIDPFLQPQD